MSDIARRWATLLLSVVVLVAAVIAAITPPHDPLWVVGVAVWGVGTGIDICRLIYAYARRPT